jgi:arylsulfatase A-like enzyme
MKSLKELSLHLIVLGAVLSPLAAASSARPNILFVLVDDQRNTSLGCAGHPQIETPVIDRLAAQGVLFERAYVHTPICMASRANLFTGLSTSTCGYHAQPRGLVQKQDVDTSFPTLLRAADYRTGFFGKQHVRFEKGVNGMAQMFDEHEVLHRNPYLKKMPDGSLRHVDEIIGDRSVAFVHAQPAGRPFFLYMSFNISHAEDSDRRPGYHFQWPAAEDGRFEDIEPLRPALDDPKYYAATPTFVRETINRDRYYWRWDTPEKYRVNMRALYRMLAGMDRIVGRVLTTLKEKGLADNTIVIYSADNGYYMGDRGFAGKWSHYDQSVHVPLIVYDPRVRSNLRGRSLDPWVSSLDIPATILNLANIPVPEKYQGMSLCPWLEGRTPSHWRKEIYSEHYSGGANLPHWYGVRNDRYTYAHYFEQNVELLYDRQKDPTELTDVAGVSEYRNVLEDLRRRSQAYQDRYTAARSGSRP